MPDHDPKLNPADLELITAAAREAGALALDHFGKAPQSWTKDDNSPVSEADLAVDQLLQQRLLDARSDYGWLSEESTDDRKRLDTETIFVVDPIDGTRSFLAKDDQWVISIAVVSANRPLSGVLYNPVRDELYTASLDQKTMLNGSPLQISETPRDQFQIAASKKAIKGLVLDEGSMDIDRRYVPSLAYRFALVATGRFDATLTSGHCRDWDLAAAMLMVERAGGTVRRQDGRRVKLNTVSASQPAILAGSRPVLDILTGKTEPSGAGSTRTKEAS